jgi:hypothetical protein
MTMSTAKIPGAGAAVPITRPDGRVVAHEISQAAAAAKAMPVIAGHRPSGLSPMELAMAASIDHFTSCVHAIDHMSAGRWRSVGPTDRTRRKLMSVATLASCESTRGEWSRMRVRALVIATLALAAACGRDEYCMPAGFAARCAGPATGTATVTAPARYGATTSVHASGGTCLGPDGTCSVPPPINVMASFVESFNDGNSLGLTVRLPAREGPATYAVSPSSTDLTIEIAGVDAALTGWGYVALLPRSGNIVVEHLTTAAFRATFDMEWETPDHEVFAITSGRVENAGCELVSYPASCQPYD